MYGYLGQQQASDGSMPAGSWHDNGLEGPPGYSTSLQQQQQQQQQPSYASQGSMGGQRQAQDAQAEPLTEITNQQVC